MCAIQSLGLIMFGVHYMLIFYEDLCVGW